MKKFLRRNSDRHSKLGRNRRKKQSWRKPKGRHNKMRDKRRGYPAIVTKGYRTKREGRGKIEGKKPFVAYNVRDVEKFGRGNLIIIGKVGKKKRVEIAKKLKEMKIPTKKNGEEKMNLSKKKE